MFVYGIADDLYERYLQQNGLSKDTYMNTENPVYLLYTNRRVTEPRAENERIIRFLQISIYIKGMFLSGNGR